jgi:hypothetical protein
MVSTCWGRGAFLLAETIQKTVSAIEPEKNTYWRLITQNWCPFTLFFILAALSHKTQQKFGVMSTLGLQDFLQNLVFKFIKTIKN